MGPIPYAARLDTVIMFLFYSILACSACINTMAQISLPRQGLNSSDSKKKKKGNAN